MGVRENKVERYLAKQVKEKLDGITRKWVSPGRDGVMDQIVFIDPEWFVEVKTENGNHTGTQKREARRLIEAGARVAIVYGERGVDHFIEWVSTRRHMQPKVQVIFK